MTKKRASFVFFTGVAIAAALGLAKAPKLTPLEEVGKKIFFDRNLSSPPGQACAACHDPKVGWTGPVSASVSPGQVYEGAVKGRFGNRKPPASAYAGDSPIFHRDEKGEFVGGMFWDGRATGTEWKDPLAEQAGGPFLNPLEQNNPDRKTVVQKVKAASYAPLFIQVWKINPADWDGQPDRIYEYIARSIAAFERSSESTAFRSKFDLFWKASRAKGLKVETIAAGNQAGFRGLGLEDGELLGLVLFNTKARCSSCHVLTPGPGEKPPAFTDYKYDNIGVPKNPDNPFYGMAVEFNPAGKKWIDQGLGEFLGGVPAYAALSGTNTGKHKAPTLRNVDVRPDPSFVKGYMHNGALKSLKAVVHFYNARDLGGFPAPEVAANLNKTEMGDLGLTGDEEDAVVAFLKTLSDRD
jgi:cytochrome c peroxidase